MTSASEPSTPQAEATSRKGGRFGQVLHRSIARSLSTAQAIIQIVILFVLVTIAAASISEIAERQALLALVSNRVEASQQAVVRLSGELRTVVSQDSNDAVAALREERRILKLTEHLQRDTHALIAVGAFGHEQRLCELRWKLANMEDVTRSMPITSAGPFASVVKRAGFDPEVAPSDHLVAIALMCCGTIGAFIAAIRRNRHSKLHLVTMGAAAGFITFLVIKGGRYVFLLQLSGDVGSLNPYSCALAALIAGLFTDRAYLLLSDVVANFASRIEAGIGDHGNNAA